MKVGAALFTGAVLGRATNKYEIRENEEKKAIEEISDIKDLDKLSIIFKGQEENFLIANKAIIIFKIKMESKKIPKVKLFGTGYPDKEIEILRTFLSKHLNSHVGHKYYCRDAILKEGYYTIDNLSKLEKESSGILNILNQNNNQGDYNDAPYEAYPPNTSPSQIPPKGGSPYVNKNLM